VDSAADVVLTTVIDRHIRGVLDATDGSLSLAAHLLGMHRRSLQRYMRRVQRRRPRRKSRGRATSRAKRR
jgi:ActR/RegA family two-component response regulator